MSDEQNTRRAFIKATGVLGVGAGAALATGVPAAAATDRDTRTWDNFGAAVILNPGASTLRSYFFAGNADVHVQITGANALAPLNGARHTALDFGKSNNAGAITYHARIRNDGAVAATHNLEGGGLT